PGWGREAVFAPEVLDDHGAIRVEAEAGERGRPGGHGERSDLIGERAVRGGEREVAGVRRELPHLAVLEPQLVGHELRDLSGELGQRHALETTAPELGDGRLAGGVAAQL